MASFHGRGNRVRQPRRAHDSVLHLLFDVRLPACRRPYLGIRRFARQGIFGWRNGGPDTLLGEGLQHQDGHSPFLPAPFRRCASYDPAFAYEIAVIVQDGIRRMYENDEGRFYYLTVCNENYAQPPMPEGIQEGVLKGSTDISAADRRQSQVQLFGSGPILNEALRRRKSWLRSFRFERMYGASPAITNCAVMLLTQNGGTA